MGLLGRGVAHDLPSYHYHISVPNAPTIPQMNPRDDHNNTSPRPHRQHEKNHVASIKVGYLRLSAQVPMQGPAQTPKVLVSYKTCLFHKSYIKNLLPCGIYIISQRSAAAAFALNSRCRSGRQSTLKIPNIGGAEEVACVGFGVVLKLQRNTKSISKQTKVAMPRATKIHLFLESLCFGTDEVPPACLEEACRKVLGNVLWKGGQRFRADLVW